MSQIISKDDWSYFSTLIQQHNSRRNLSIDDLTSKELLLRESLSKYLFLLEQKNKEINLTAIESFELAVWKHLYDSLLLIHLEPMGALLDWGSGGGTPGIPLALFRQFISADNSRVICLDSVAKKINCVSGFADALNLSHFSTACSRGETFLIANKVDAVIMRAVAPAERAVKWVSPKVSRWVFMTGPRGRQEWDAFIPQMRSRGFSVSFDNKFTLPFSHGERHILSFSL